MKKWYQSKTLWFNILTVLVGTVGELTNVITMDAKTAQIFAAVLAVGNFILRFLTTTSIASKPS